jgi:hypothetical protein
LIARLDCRWLASPIGGGQAHLLKHLRLNNAPYGSFRTKALGIDQTTHSAVDRHTQLLTQTLPLWQSLHGDSALCVDLSTVEDVQHSMAESLAAHGITCDKGVLPASKIPYDLVQAALRQKDLYYNVSLPHYEYESFQSTGISRCVFLAHLSLPVNCTAGRSCSCLWIWVLGTLASSRRHMAGSRKVSEWHLSQAFATCMLGCHIKIGKTKPT